MLFTVIICSQAFIDKCQSAYCGFLKPLLDNDEQYAFCPWDATKQTMDEAVPDLRRLIDKKKDWRAVAVLDDEIYGRHNILKRNPFNFVDSENLLKDLKSLEEVAEFRKKTTESCRKTIDNPLMKLGIWLDGSPLNAVPGLSEKYPDEPDGLNRDYFDKLGTGSHRAIEYEVDRLVQVRKSFLEENFSAEGELPFKPKQFIAVSERVLSSGHEEAEEAWKLQYEFAYSRFSEDNLYPAKFKYILFDIPYVKGVRKESDYLNFLVFVLVLAQNDSTSNVMMPGKVYRVNIKMDKEKINVFYSSYLGRLMATVSLLEKMMKKKVSDSKDPLDNAFVRENYESNIKIPVAIGSAHSTDNLFAECKGLGLATDCPKSEEAMWDEQSHDIMKSFIRYIREPRRAVKRAAEKELHIRSEIDDEKIVRLTESQKEDIAFRLVEEEDKMVGTVVPKIFKSEEYIEQIEKEDKAIRRNISHRMTKKTTVAAGVISLAAFLFGLLPLIFNNVNDGEAFGAAILIILCCLAILAVSGIIYLVVQHFKLKTRFKWFNKVMRMILGDIDSGLESFSQYFSHACNVMRCFSVLNYSQKEFAEKKNIYKKHIWDIEKKIDEIIRIFAGYIDTDSPGYYEAEPFDYDFSVLCDYEYDLPYEQMVNRITFLQSGEKIDVPINYVSSIKLEVESFYDQYC